ncbi:MAG: MgtC/SapB family protein [Planctomycetota bacterium]|jgi:putative Mg2+ transporter-C (MgtC) family protein
MPPNNIFELIDWYSLAPILISVLLGGIIGLEREIHHKPAGLRTIIMIATGATLFTVIADRFPADASLRIIQGVITGVGFIGAGAIIRDRASVHGITTAATIWLTTGIGIACGMRLYQLAVGVTIIALIILWGLSPLDQKITQQSHNRRATDPSNSAD